MSRSVVRRALVGVSFVLLVASSCGGSTSSTLAQEESAVLRILGGAVEVDGGSGSFVPGTDGQILQAGFTIRTGTDGRAAIEYFDGSVTRLDHDTTFRITALKTLDNATDSKVIEGEQTSGSTYSRVTPLTDSESRFDVVTPTATASVEGTKYAIFLNPDGTTTVAVVDGAVNVVHTGGTTAVASGFMAVIAPDGTIGDPVPIPEALLNSDWIVFNQCVLDDEGECQVDVEPAPLASIEIDPQVAAVEFGQSQEYTAEGFDAEGNSLGSVDATYEIVTGSCVESACTGDTPGEHTVTGSFEGFSDTAVLTVGGVGALEITLSWSGPADLDLWVTDPSGQTVRYDSAASNGGRLLADAHKDCEAGSPEPPETVVWPIGAALPGSYVVTVNYWTECGAGSVGFKVSARVGGDTVLSTIGFLAEKGSSYTTGFTASGGS